MPDVPQRTERKRQQEERRRRTLRSARYAAPYRFNTRARRYIDARGRFVSQEVLRAAYNDALDDAGREVHRLAARLKRGDITLADWQRTMMRQIKDVHLTSAAVARGGFEQLTPADLGRVGQIVRGEYAYLDGFARDLVTGRQPFDGNFPRRAAMYVDAGSKTFSAEMHAIATEGGFDEERSYTSDADHCPGCIRERDREWVARGALVPIGERDCRASCRCHIVFRRSATGETFGG